MSVIDTTIVDDSGSTLPAAPPALAHRPAERRAVVLAGAGALFGAIFVLRQFVFGPADALGLLYVIPVSLTALELGMRAGLLAALAATTAIGLWMVTEAHVGGQALLVRALILLSVGALAGRFSDRMRSHGARDESLLREQAALKRELETLRKRLGEQLRNASQLIERQEQERRGIAKQLHDEAAQAMAAALLTVGLLSRGASEELSASQLEEVRREVKACIVDLRHIASSLRPPALDEMGLAMALERFADLEAEHGKRLVTFSVEDFPKRLAPEVETSTYRVIEELLQALRGAASVAVAVTSGGSRVRVVFVAWPRKPGEGEAGDRGQGAEANGAAAEGSKAEGAKADSANMQSATKVEVELIAARARVELIGGSLQEAPLPGGGRRIVAEIPRLAKAA